MDRQLLRSIAALSLPAVVTNITTPLLALCDVAIVGHMGSAVYIAAIAVGGTMFNMLYWLCGFLRMGSSGTTAQAFGAGNMLQVHAIVRRAMAIAFFIAMAFIIFRHPIATLLLDFIDAEPAAREMAMEYFGICIWGAPAVLGTFALTGWFIGLQNSRIPMWISIFINVFNIVVSLTLVYAAGLKISGVAFGTLSAQWGGFLLGLAVGLRKYGLVRVGVKLLLAWDDLRTFLRINSDIFLRTFCLVAVTLWFTRVGAMQGTVMLAVNTLLMQFFTIFSYMMDGLAFAGEALCGRYLGADDRPRLRQTVRGLTVVGAVASLIFTIVYFAGGDAFLVLLSSEGAIVASSKEFFGWAVAIPLLSFMAFVGDGVMIGMTRTRAMLASMVVGAAVYFLLYLFLFPRIGNHGLWIAFLAYLLSRGIVLGVEIRKI